MAQRQSEYLLFADVLGTGALYKANKSDLLERRKTALGHCIRTAVYPFFDPASGCKIRINQFSDTALVVSTSIRALMEATAQLFYVFSLRTRDATAIDELFLLRGGIARGEILTSSSLSSGEHVEVAQIFDTSLSLAHELQGIRRGSRVFLGPETYDMAIADSIHVCHKWQAIPGIGPPVSPAFEFLWPVRLFEPTERFGKYLEMLCSVWYRLFTTQAEWKIPEYDSTLYHLDETIKLCIRSAAFAPRGQARQTWDRLITYLPTENPALSSLDIRFTWGTWFQILWTLLLLKQQFTFLPSKASLRDLIGRNMRLAEARGKMATILTELENPDYSWFREQLVDLKLL
jgi:hypothetical protein